MTVFLYVSLSLTSPQRDDIIKLRPSVLHDSLSFLLD